MSNKTYLYNAGDLCSTLTGGWSTSAGYSSTSTIKTHIDVTYNSNNITMWAKSAERTRPAVAITRTQKKINLDNVDFLYADVSRSANDKGYGLAYLAITQADSTEWSTGRPGTSLYQAPPYDTYVYTANLGASTLALNVSALTGEYYVVIANYEQGEFFGNDRDTSYIHIQSTTVIKSVWMENYSASQGMYTGVGNVAHKMASGYIGINNVARKLTKAYVGVNNVARLVWDGERGTVQSEPKIFYYDGADPSGLTGGFGTSYETLVWVMDDDDDDQEYDCESVYAQDSTMFDTKVIYMNADAGGNVDIRLCRTFTKQIDVTYIDSIEITYATNYRLSGILALSFQKSNHMGSIGNYVCYNDRLGDDNNTILTYTLDCSHINGQYYLFLGLNADTNENAKFYISKIVANYTQPSK